MVSQVRLLLIRHGQTPSNVDGKLDTAMPGAGLTRLGEIQAQAIPEALANEDVAGVYVSRLMRTQLTAAPLAGVRDVEARLQPGLEEISAGDLEMRSDEEARHTYLHTVASWLLGDLSVRMPGGETGEQFLARYDAAVSEVVESGAETALVVSHGAAIRTWVGQRSLDHGSGRWADVALEPLRNTGCIELELTGDGWRILDWQTHPIGGAFLEDPTAEDPTGSAPTE